MPECRTIRHLVSPELEWKKLTMPVQVQYWTKPMQSGIFLVRYRNKIMDASVSFLDANAQLSVFQIRIRFMRIRIQPKNWIRIHALTK